jgi:hypothetical protein
MITTACAAGDPVQVPLTTTTSSAITETVQPSGVASPPTAVNTPMAAQIDQPFVTESILQPKAPLSSAAGAAPTPTPTPNTPVASVPSPPVVSPTSKIPPVASAPSAGRADDAAQPRGFVIDHTAVADFQRIPDEYIRAASQLRLLLRGASVGVNISDGLNCLANNFSGRRPYFCDRDLPPDQVVFDPKYDRSHWTFELHNPPPNPNPAWPNKVKFFIDRVNGLEPHENYDVVSFTADYVDVIEGLNMDDTFFQPATGGEFSPVQALEDLTSAHPDKTIVWWTSNLARTIGTPDSVSFNQQMRDYTRSHGKILFDMADIESHAPDGTPCVDNLGRGLPAICQDYTTEQVAGHLNALGSQRVARALWVLMARLAGWEG